MRDRLFHGPSLRTASGKESPGWWPGNTPDLSLLKLKDAKLCGLSRVIYSEMFSLQLGPRCKPLFKEQQAQRLNRNLSIRKSVGQSSRAARDFVS